MSLNAISLHVVTDLNFCNETGLFVQLIVCLKSQMIVSVYLSSVHLLTLVYFVKFWTQNSQFLFFRVGEPLQ